MSGGSGFAPDLVSPAYRALLREANSNPEVFWGRKAEGIHWFQRWQKVLESNPPEFRWFVGGLANLGYNRLDSNLLAGRGGRAALIAENELGERRVYTYYQLSSEAKKVAAAHRGIGVSRGAASRSICPRYPKPSFRCSRQSGLARFTWLCLRASEAGPCQTG